MTSPFSADGAAWTARAAAYLCFLLVAATIPYHLLLGSPAYLGLFEDDYFYYATVADNLVRSGRLTYDGVTLTNGFHPLWFVVVTLLRLICGRFGIAYYMGFTLIALLAMITTYELSVRFARILDLRRGIAEVVSAIYAVGTARLMTTGLEVAIAVPLLLWLFVAAGLPGPLTVKRGAQLGMIASLAVLARLDVAIAVAVLIVGFLVFLRPKPRAAIRLLATFGAGGFLLPAYLVMNLWMFGSVFSVSAQAKQLYSGFGFNVGYAKTVALYTFFGPTVGVLLPAGIAAFILLVRRSHWRCSTADFVGATALAFGFVLWGLNALSGWIFFGWYAYPVVTASVAAAAFIWREWGSIVSVRRGLATAATIVALGLPVGVGVRYSVEHGPLWSVSDNSLLAIGYDLAPRMRDRPGVYAMGAIAGVVAYVLDRPFVQLEGIISDRRMVEHIRRQDALEDVLRENNVDYLIVSYARLGVVEADGCFDVTQPHEEWAGPRTNKMRGTICSPPVERFITPAGMNSWSIFPSIETLVWNVRDAHWKPRTD